MNNNNNNNMNNDRRNEMQIIDLTTQIADLNEKLERQEEIIDNLRAKIKQIEGYQDVAHDKMRERRKKDRSRYSKLGGNLKNLEGSLTHDEHVNLLQKKPRKSVCKWFDYAGRRLRKCKYVGDSTSDPRKLIHEPSTNPKRDKDGYTLQQRCALCAHMGKRTDVTSLCFLCETALCSKNRNCFKIFHEVDSLEHYKNVKHQETHNKRSMIDHNAYEPDNKRPRRTAVSVNTLVEVLTEDPEPVIVPSPPFQGTPQQHIQPIPTVVSAKYNNNNDNNSDNNNKTNS